MFENSATAHVYSIKAEADTPPRVDVSKQKFAVNLVISSKFFPLNYLSTVFSTFKRIGGQVNYIHLVKLESPMLHARFQWASLFLRRRFFKVHILYVRGRHLGHDLDHLYKLGSPFTRSLHMKCGFN